MALLASDHAWLWNRGYEGGGPQLELLRRLAHWMMKEPELEEEALLAEVSGGLDVRFTRRYRSAGGEVRLFLELINLANRENVFAYDYEKEIAADGTPFLARESESWFPLLPSIGASWSW